jgi:hypothetical protein
MFDLIGSNKLVARDKIGLFGPRHYRSKGIHGRVDADFLG